MIQDGDPSTDRAISRRPSTTLADDQQAAVSRPRAAGNGPAVMTHALQ
jgi:hypothetical protein